MGQLLQFQNERAAKKSDGSTPSSDHWEAQEEEDREEEEGEDNVVLSISSITTATLPLSITTAKLPVLPVERGSSLTLPIGRGDDEEEECVTSPNPPGGARAFAFGE